MTLATAIAHTGELIDALGVAVIVLGLVVAAICSCGSCGSCGSCDAAAGVGCTGIGSLPSQWPGAFARIARRSRPLEFVMVRHYH